MELGNFREMRDDVLAEASGSDCDESESSGARLRNCCVLLLGILLLWLLMVN